MKIISCLFALFVLFFGLANAQTRLIFSEDFNELDLTKWQPEITLGGGGNNEFQYYANNRSNSYVKNGILYIKPTLTSSMIGEQTLVSGTLNLWGSQPADQCTGNSWDGCFRQSSPGGPILPPIQSARLRTVNSLTFKYGKVEVRAKLPRGDWLWPAIWMLPQKQAYGPWPASGEIDIMEARGNGPTYQGGVASMSSALHWGPWWGENRWSQTWGWKALQNGRTFADDFHVFGLVWNETNLYTYVDTESQKVMDVKFQTSLWSQGNFASRYDNPWAGRPNSAPFDQPFYLILNVAVGGTTGFFADGNGKPWNNGDPLAVNAFWNARNQWLPTWQGENAALQIDYIKVYKDY